jgi:hypothetical protein
LVVALESVIFFIIPFFSSSLFLKRAEYLPSSSSSSSSIAKARQLIPILWLPSLVHRRSKTLYFISTHVRRNRPIYPIWSLTIHHLLQALKPFPLVPKLPVPLSPLTYHLISKLCAAQVVQAHISTHYQRLTRSQSKKRLDKKHQDKQSSQEGREKGGQGIEKS